MDIWLIQHLLQRNSNRRLMYFAAVRVVHRYKPVSYTHLDVYKRQIAGILITVGLLAKKVPAAVFVGMVITAGIGLICGSFGIEGMPAIDSVITTDFNMNTVGAFMSGFEELFADPGTAFVMIFSFLFVDFFDTAGTLVAVANRVGLVNEQGELENVERALLADAVGTAVSYTHLDVMFF